MANPVTSKSHFEKLIFPNCCFLFTLRAGSLIIGVISLILGILWLIGGASIGSSGFSSLITTILMLVAGIFIIVAIKKEEVKYLWWSVYMYICISIWFIIFIIIMFATLRWGLAVGGIFNAIFAIYFTSILRSYAFEMESGSSGAPATTA